MKRRLLSVFACSALAWGGASLPVNAQIAYSETFDSAASAKVRANLTYGDNMELRYLDYSSFMVGSNAFSIPEAPLSGSLGGPARSGVLMRSLYNGTSRILNLLPADVPGGTPLAFSDDYRVRFDMWLSLDPGTTTASAGTTEIGVWGIGHDGGAVPLGRSYRNSAVGTWGWLATDGGFGNTLNAGDAAFRINTNQVAIWENPSEAALWTVAWPANPDIPGATYDIQNPPWNSWTTVEVYSLNGWVSVSFNGVQFFNYASAATTGSVVIGYEDPFTGSASWSPDWQWGLFDNLIIEVPEPSVFGLMVLGSLGFLALRRRS